MKFDKKDLTNSELVDIYKALILPRSIEEKMLILLRQGKISKWFSGWGQEAETQSYKTRVVPKHQPRKLTGLPTRQRCQIVLESLQVQRVAQVNAAYLENT